MKQIKIAFSGTHSCGKTTAINEVYQYLKSKGYKSVGTSPEVTRWCPFELNQKTTFKSQYWVLTHHIMQEIILRKYDILLCDRSVLDNIAYAKYANIYSHNISSRDLYFLKIIGESWISHGNYYTATIFLSPLPIEDDNLRSPELKYQQRINDIMLDIIQKCSYNNSRLNIEPKYAGKEARIRYIKKVLNKIIPSKM
jgi:GTPase SAR1 family protein